MYDDVVNCFVAIIEATAGFEPVLVGCSDRDEVVGYFSKETKYPIHFEIIPSDDTWARDHGAITVIDNNKAVLLDFTFNGWGQKFEATKDNNITQELTKSAFAHLEIMKIPFVLEGGGIESDGKGTLLTTSECMLSPYRNPEYSQEEISEYLKSTFGVQKVLWLDHGYLAGDDTDSHIDTLARLCDEKTIAYVHCDDPNDEHYEALQKMEAQLRTFTNTNGNAYQLVALPWPQSCYDADGERIPATYANFLIVNGGVLVPTYRVPQDAFAIQIIQSIFPDRKVVGLDCLPLIDQHGSLHCISMQYPVAVNMEVVFGKCN